VHPYPAQPEHVAGAGGRPPLVDGVVDQLQQRGFEP
jgi:hypothetical protein